MKETYQRYPSQTLCVKRHCIHADRLGNIPKETGIYKKRRIKETHRDLYKRPVTYLLRQKGRASTGIDMAVCHRRPVRMNIDQYKKVQTVKTTCKKRPIKETYKRDL